MQVASATLVSAELHERFATSKRVIVLTGAGVSAESGVPTFRGGGQTAAWKGIPFEVISSAGMLARDLSAVWEWFNFRRERLVSIQPNAAHAAIAEWQNRFEDFALVTQNIDNLHQQAGSRNVVELHGNIWRACCLECGSRRELRELRIDHEVPECIDCGGHMRPDVVLFGEMLPPGAFERAAAAASHAELCLVIGTSAVVYPAAAIPEIASNAGAYVVEVNPERTALSDLCDEALMGKAGEILPMFSHS